MLCSLAHAFFFYWNIHFALFFVLFSIYIYVFLIGCRPTSSPWYLLVVTACCNSGSTLLSEICSERRHSFDPNSSELNSRFATCFISDLGHGIVRRCFGGV